MTSQLSPCFHQLLVGPTHARGGTLDILMTDVPYLAWVAVVAPIGNSDHSSLWAVILMALAVPNLCAGRKALLMSIGILSSAIQDLSWHNIWLADNPVDVLNENLSLLV